MPTRAGATRTTIPAASKIKPMICRFASIVNTSSLCQTRRMQPAPGLELDCTSALLMVVQKGPEPSRSPYFLSIVGHSVEYHPSNST